MSNPATVLYPPVNQVTSTIVTVARRYTLFWHQNSWREALIRLAFFTNSENRV